MGFVVAAAVAAANTAAAARCFCASTTLSGIVGGGGGFGIFDSAMVVFGPVELLIVALTLAMAVVPSEPAFGAALSDEGWSSALLLSPKGFCATKKSFGRKLS